MIFTPQKASELGKNELKNGRFIWLKEYKSGLFRIKKSWNFHEKDGGDNIQKLDEIILDGLHPFHLSLEVENLLNNM